MDANRVSTYLNLDALNLALSDMTFEQEEILLSSIFEFAEKQAYKHQVPISKILRSFKGSGYRYALVLPMVEQFDYSKSNSKTPHLIIFLSPSGMQTNKLLFSFKGYPYDQIHYIYARLWMMYLTRGMKDKAFLSSTNIAVTLNHIALDIEGSITSFGIERRRCSKAMYFHDKGSLTGINLGSNRSTKRTTAYDINANFRIKDSRLSRPQMFRIEEKIRKRIPWRKLGEFTLEMLQNYDITFYDIEAILEANNFDTLTKNCIRNIGIHNVIRAQKEPNEIRRIRKLIQPHQMNLDLTTGSDSSVAKMMRHLSIFCDWESRKKRKIALLLKKEFIRKFLQHSD